MFDTILGIIYIVIAVLCFIYEIAIGRVQSGSMFFLIWGVLGLVFMGMGIIRIRHVEIPKAILVSYRVLAGIAILAFLIIEGLIISCFSRIVEDGVDYLIVAGAQVIDDRPSIVLKYRLDTAVEYLNKHPETMCIVSGGKGSNESRSEADVMADYLIENGISKDRIIREDRSTTTAENMIFSAKLYDAENSSTAIITNNFHLYRALYLAKKHGIKDPKGIAAPSSLFYQPNNMFREFFCVIKDIVLQIE